MKPDPKIQKELMLDLKHDFPPVLEIETISYCNARCLFCPYPVVKDTLPMGTMDDTLFHKIIDECSNYSVEIIGPTLFTEPLLDKKIFERIKLIHNRMPSAKIFLFTNGSLLCRRSAELLVSSPVDFVSFNFVSLQKEKYEKTMRLDFEKTLANIKYYVHLKNKEDGCSTRIRVKAFKNFLSVSEEKQFINYWKDKGAEACVDDLDDRAGNVLSGNGVEIKKPFHGKLKGCNNYNRPFRIFHVLFNGDVVLCCRDWRQEVILGNIREDNIYHVWNSPQYEYIRKVITSKEECHEEFLCSRCIYAVKEP